MIRDKSILKRFDGFLLILVILMQFIPLPVIPFINVSPISIVLLIFILHTLFFKFKKIIAVPIIVKIFLIIFLLFAILDYLLNFYLGISRYGFGKNIKTILTILLFCIACNNADDIKKATSFICIGILISSIVGILIYFFDGAFQTLRYWLFFGSSEGVDLLSSGGYITGLCSQHFLFGYLMAGAPMLALTLYVSTKKKKWIPVFFIFIFALIFNGQRSALLMNTIAILIFFSLFGIKSNLKFLLIVFSAVLIMFFLKEYRPMHSQTYPYTKTVLGRVESSEDALDRIKWQINGIKCVLAHPITGVSDEQYEKYSIKHKVFWKNKVPYPHNHYINIGFRVGVWAWILLVILLIILKKIIKRFKNNAYNDAILIPYYKGIIISFFAVMGNALFHNAGIFTGEQLSVCLLGLIMAGSSMVISKVNEDEN